MSQQINLRIVSFEELGTQDPSFQALAGDKITYMAGSDSFTYDEGLLQVAEKCNRLFPTMEALIFPVTRQAQEIHWRQESIRRWNQYDTGPPVPAVNDQVSIYERITSGP